MIHATDYAEVLAKIGAERGTLLTNATLLALTESKNLQEFANQLREISYAQTMARIAAPVDSRKLEDALKETLIEIYIKIIKYSPKNVRPFLALRLLAIEMEGIKTLVKAITAKLSTEEKIARVHLSTEEYFKRTAVFKEALSAMDLRTFTKVFKQTTYTQALTLGLRRYEQTGSTQSFDILLDKEFYDRLWANFQKLPKREKKHAMFYACLENDIFTLTTILRGKIIGYEPNWLRLAVPSGNFKISKEVRESMITASDFDSVLNMALKTYGSLLGKASNPDETVTNLQIASKKALFIHAYKSAIRETFNIEAPLSFMVQKEFEIRNLESIALGLEIARKPEEIQATLLLKN